ncbi:MAG: hypothetical protein JKY37_25740 [Nannocystaceae bacterium]|nr:hypothetical protein [Nannocystaceae bacterium]
MAHKHVLIALALSVALPACAGRKAVWSDGSAPTDGAGTPDAAASETSKKSADDHWNNRTSPDEIRAAITAWEAAVKANPADLASLISLTRANYFLADGYTRGDDKAYLALMDKAVHWGEEAMVVASPEFAAKMRDGGKFPEAVKLVGKPGVPAMYWYASALGKWAKKKGFAVLVGQKDNVKATMDRCLELDELYFFAGPWRYFGAFYAIAPAFAGGDLAKSIEHFKKSLELQPNYVGTKVLWAAELATEQQDEETFDKLLNEVLATPDDVIPELKPETIVEKQKARELLAQHDDLF